MPRAGAARSRAATRTLMWTAPCLHVFGCRFWIGSVASMCPACVCGGEAAGQDGFRGVGSKPGRGVDAPLDCAQCPSPWIDRPHHLLPALQARVLQARVLQARLSGTRGGRACAAGLVTPRPPLLAGRGRCHKPRRGPSASRRRGRSRWPVRPRPASAAGARAGWRATAWPAGWRCAGLLR